MKGNRSLEMVPCKNADVEKSNGVSRSLYRCADVHTPRQGMKKISPTAYWEMISSSSSEC